MSDRQNSGNSLSPGQKIGQYEIVGKIGAGGMGEVWEAIDTKLERKIAIKLLPSEAVTNDSQVERFEREAKIVANLNHPNIVHLYSVEEIDGIKFITMELVEGNGLDHILKTEKLSFEKILHICTLIVDALAAAHEKNIIHRDLKPANIMLTKNGHIKVLDFGLAKLIDKSEQVSDETKEMALTQVGSVMGTVPYMSPEQLRGQEVDHRSDIFSAGILIYEMTTGKHPFEGVTNAEVSSHILTKRPDEVNQIIPELPPILGQIVARCLEKNPNDRYQSAADLCHDLKTTTREVEHGNFSSPHSAMRSVPSAREEIASKSNSGIFFKGTIGIIVLIIAVYAIYSFSFQSVKAVESSIAVLPFNNVSPNEDNEFFVVGVHEDVINKLASIKDLKVISKTSVLSFANFTGDIKEMGKKLGAKYIVEGSVRRMDNQIRVSANLVEVATDQTLWSQNYDRELKDVFALQSEIAQEIATTLNATITREESEQLQKVPTVVMAAYDDYLKARSVLTSQWVSYQTIVEAIQYLESAVQTDPDFIDGWALLTRALSDKVDKLRQFDDRKSEIQDAEQSVLQALAKTEELAPNSIEAFTTRGYYQEKVLKDEMAALRSYDKALEIDPNDPEVLFLQALTYFSLGQIHSLIPNIEYVYQIDRANGFIVFALTFAYEITHQYQKLADFYNQRLTLFPERTHYKVEATYYQFLSDGSLNSYHAFENAIKTIPRTEGCDVRSVQNMEAIVAIMDNRFEEYTEAWEGKWDRHHQGHGDWSCPLQINDEANHARLLMKFGETEKAEAIITRARNSTSRPVNEQSVCIFDKIVYEPKLDYLSGDSVIARKNFEDMITKVLKVDGFPRSIVERRVLLETADVVAPDRVYSIFKDISDDPTSLISMEVICANPWVYPNLIKDERFIADVKADGRFVEFLESYGLLSSSKERTKSS